MTTKRLSALGIVTYWSTSETKLDKLKAACMAVDAGLEKYIPEASTPLSALRQALEIVFPGHLVRKLDRDGFAVVKEDKGQDANDYDSVASGWFEDDNLITHNVTDAQRKAIHQNYNGHRGILQPVQVGTFLSRILGEYLGGTMLRPKTGGVYWLPDDRAGKWQKIADVVESAAISSGESAVYVLRHSMDEDSVRAVKDAIIHELSGEAERINEDVTGGDLGAKALATREREAVALIKKAQRYEVLLSASLAGVRKSLESAKDAAAAAAIVASTAEESEVEERDTRHSRV